VRLDDCDLFDRRRDDRALAGGRLEDGTGMIVADRLANRG
jgi:hypothetical protein